MSIEALSWAWQQTGIKPTEKLTLLAIADHADELGKNAFPSCSRLARKTGLAEATVHRAIKSLAGRGKIHIEKVKSRAGDFDHNEYTLSIDNVTISRGVVSQRDHLRGGGWSQGERGVVSQCVSNLPLNHPKEKTPSKKKEVIVNPTQEFIAWYSHQYEEVLKRPLIVRWGRDMKLMKPILAAYPLETSKKIAEGLLHTADQWLRNTGRDIPILSSQWNKLAGQGAVSDEQEGPSLRVL